MTSRDNGASSFGDDASNIRDNSDWTQQEPGILNITSTDVEGVTKGGQSLDTDPTQPPLFVENAEDIVRDSVHLNELGNLDNSGDMPYTVRVRERLVEYTYTEDDVPTGAIVGEEDVVGIEEDEGTEPLHPGHGDSFRSAHAGHGFGGPQPPHIAHGQPLRPTDLLFPQQGSGPRTEPREFGNVGDPSDNSVPRQPSGGRSTPSFNNGPRTTNFAAQSTTYGGSIPARRRSTNNDAHGQNPISRDPRLEPRVVDENTPELSQEQESPYQARSGRFENSADLASMLSKVDDDDPAFPRPQTPLFGRRPVGDPRQATGRTNYSGTTTRRGPRISQQPTLYEAPGPNRNGVNVAGNVRQQDHRHLPYAQNLDNPSAQMIPVDAFGNPTRPSTARLAPRPGPLGLGTPVPRLRQEDIPAGDHDDDESEEPRFAEPQPGRRRRHQQAFTRSGDLDDDESDDEGTELQRTKRGRKDTVAEGEGEKKKYEKRPGVVRLEGPTENLQVFDPHRKDWRDVVYHQEIRAILFQNAGSTSQYRFPRASGIHPGDQTSFLAVQRDWGLERPAGWDRVIDRILYRLECNGYEPPVGLRGEPEYMMHNDRVVIDRENHPIRDWPLIPATLSTQFEGGYIEAIRRICAGIRLYDFWARMPTDHNDRSIGVTGLSNRAERFRNDNGLAPWRSKSGGTELRDAIREKMSQADRDANSTRDIAPLTEAELAAAKAKNKESAATKAKSRTHQARIAKQKQAKEKQKMQLQDHEEQTEAEEDNAEDSFTAKDKNRPAEDEGDEDE